MRLLGTSTLLTLTLLLSACATPRAVLTPEMRAKIVDIKAYVVVVQDEIIVAVHPSEGGTVAGALGFGLAGGLIGFALDGAATNTRIKDAQEVMASFYTAIEDIDYRKALDETMRRDLSRYPIKVSELATTPRALSNKSLFQLRQQLGTGQALMVISSRYTLSMDFRSLDAISVVTLWPQTDDIPVKPQAAMPIQRSEFHYQSKLVGPGGLPSMELWSADNAALFRSTLQEAAAETARMIIMDMDVAATTTAKPAELMPYALNTGAQIEFVRAELLEKDDSRVVVLGWDRKIYSLPKTPPDTATGTP